MNEYQYRIEELKASIEDALQQFVDHTGEQVTQISVVYTDGGMVFRVTVEGASG